MSAGTVGDVRAGRAVVELSVSDKLKGGLDRALNSVKGFQGALAVAGTAMAAIASARVVTGIYGLARTFASVGDEIGKMSKRTGLAASSISELRFAAQQSGTSIDAVEISIRKMQKTITDANSGMLETKKAFSEIGLSAADLRGLSPEKQFSIIAKRISEIQDPTVRAAAALDIFGKSGTSIIPLANDFEALQKEARALGIVMSDEDAKAAEDLTDAFGRMDSLIQAIGLNIGASLTPAMLEMLDALKETVAEINKFIIDNRAAIQSVIGWARATGDFVQQTSVMTTFFDTVKAGAKSAGIAIDILSGDFETAGKKIQDSLEGITFDKFIKKGTSLGRAMGDLYNEIFGPNQLTQKEVNKKLGAPLDLDPAKMTKAIDDSESPERVSEREKFEKTIQDRIQKLQIDRIDDVYAKEIATIRQKYDLEYDKAREIGADLTQLALAQNDELAKIDADFAKKKYEQRAQLERKFHDLVIDGIDDEYQQSVARINAKYDEELKSAGNSSDAIGIINQSRELELLRAQQKEANRAANELEQKRSKGSSADVSRSYEISSLMLEANFKGVELERKKLELAKMRALFEASAIGANLQLVEEEFALREKLLAMQGETFDVAGTFSNAAAAALAEGTSTADDRIAKATEESAKQLKRIASNTENNAVVGNG